MVMIVVTAMLLFLLMVFAPIKFDADIYLHLQKLCADISAKVGVIRVFDEQLALMGKTLHCQGTISAELDIEEIRSKSNVDLLKCITVDRISLCLQNNIFDVSPMNIVVQNVVASIAMSTLCNMFHCQFYTQILGTLDDSKIHANIVASFSVAELSYCLAAQGVKSWKTRKSRK